MGNCGCKSDGNEIDEYLKKHHKPCIKPEKNNYEITLQDRSVGDRDLFISECDLSRYLKQDGRRSQAKNGSGDDAADAEIDQEFLKEICQMSSLSTSKSSNLEGGFDSSGNFRPSNQVKGLCNTKLIREDYDIQLDGDFGSNGRPRFKEEIKLPTQYDSIDLNDPNDEVLFQGELVKYKAGLNPSYLNRWIQVTEKALRVFKGRCNAITCCNKPLTAIPILAMKKVERVNFDLFFNKREMEKAASFNPNQFEIFLKDDFIDMYLRPEYESRVTCNHDGHSHGANESKNHGSQIQGNSPGARNFQSSNQASMMRDLRSSSPSRSIKHQSPGKVREAGPNSHAFTAPEMKQRFQNLEEGQRYSNLQDKIMQSVNTQGSWSNREEEWYFTNKRLLFSTKSTEITDQWVEKLGALVTTD